MMSYKDLLVGLASYPERTPGAMIDQAIAVAAALGARLSALTFEIDIPPAANVLARTVLDVDGMMAAERRKSAEHARALLAEFEAAATRRGILHEGLTETCLTSQVPDMLTGYARLRDLTMVPVGDETGFQQYVAESVIFGSGRPVLILPEGAPQEFDLRTVAVAWDFSRPAARAVADALPLLGRAQTVRIVTVVNEKAFPGRGSGPELARHLSHHGIKVILDEEDAAGRPIGEALESYCQAHRTDLLVMGAYGHSRMRDFFLGGATKSVLTRPVRPVLLSH